MVKVDKAVKLAADEFAEVYGQTNGHHPKLRTLVKASTIPAEPVDWFMRGRIPFSMLTLVAGDPGQGKSVMCREFVAMATQGRDHPLWDMQTKEPLTAIWLTKEESIKHALIPNLITAGADMDRVLIPRPEDDDDPDLQELLFDSTGLADIERWLSETGARLLIIDPLMGYLEAGTKANDNLTVRIILQRLIKICERHNCALLGIVHLNKNAKGTPLQRVAGAGAWVQLSRAVLFLGCDPDDKETKAVEEVKHSLAAKRPPVGYEVSEEGQMVWLTESSLTADRMCEEKDRPTGNSHTKNEECKEWLEAELQYGAHLVSALIERADNAGYSKSLVYKVADRVAKSKANQPTEGRGRGPAWWAGPSYDWSRHEWPDPFA